MNCCSLFSSLTILVSFLISDVFPQNNADDYETKHSVNREVLVYNVDHRVEQRAPICGLLAMRVASQSVDREIDLNVLLDQKYISHPRFGSSVSDLTRLAADHGLYTEHYTTLDLGCFGELSMEVGIGSILLTLMLGIGAITTLLTRNKTRSEPEKRELESV